MKQRFFDDRAMVVVLAVMSAFPPLSTDLYLPALPQMVEALGTSQAHVNLTLSLFFVFFALGTLIWGPLSEKYGRHPILVVGLSIFTLASVGCAMSGNVGQLIAARIFQAFGGGAATAVATSMVKDMYSGKKREAVLAMVMSLVIIAPVVAPVIGALLLKFISWRAVFWMLACIGSLVMILSAFLDETLEDRYTGSIINSIGRLAVVMKNPGFSSLLGIFSLVPMPLMAFIAASSYVYIKGFGLTEEMFSYYFAFNALGAMVGPMIYIRLSRLMDSKKIVSMSFALLAICGVVLNTAGHLSPAVFALTMVAATLAVGMLRPSGANLLLAQQQKDTGSAASLINFFGMLMGSAGMFLVSLNPGDFIGAIGTIQILVGIAGGSLWLMIRNRPFIRQEG